MPIQDNGTRNQYTASPAQTIFPYTFEIFVKEDIAVEQNGVVLSEGTHYTVSDVGIDSGGDVTLVTGATSGDIITIYRDMELNRVTDYQNNGDFLAQTVDNDFDRLWAALQQNSTTSSLALRAPIDDTRLNSTNTILADVDTRKSKFLAFDANGDIAYSSGTGSGGGGTITAAEVTYNGTTVKATIDAYTLIDSVASMVATSAAAGASYRTTSYISGVKGGSALYLIKTAAQAATDGDVIDEYANHTLANTNVAILQKDGIVDFRAVGGRLYDAATKIDNSAALLAADAQGLTIQVVGAYYFSVPVDLGIGGTDLRAQILGVENSNFDGADKSAFYFENSNGLTLFAGCKLQDIEIKGLGGKVGTGLVLDNVHDANVKNVTITNFTKGAYIFCWVSSIDNLITYQCTTGIETYDECTSTTFKSCYAREGTTGIILGQNVTYCTFLNCAVDDCDIPYLFKGGSNVDFNNCGAEISHANIDGFFALDGTAAATVTISGGRFITSGFTVDSIIYTTAGAVNTFGTTAFSRMTSNSFTNPVSGFVVGKARVVLDDSCMFSDALNLEVKEGEFGSIMMDGRSSGTLRRYAKKTPKVGCSQDDTDSIPDMLSIVIEEVVDFQQAITDTEVVFVKFWGVEATSKLQLKVELFPLTNTGTGSPYTYQEFAGWGFGSSQAFGSNIIGTAFDYKLNDANGFQNFYIKRSAIQGLAFVRVTATGWSDSGYRDRLISLTVGPDDA